MLCHKRVVVHIVTEAKELPPMLGSYLGWASDTKY